MTLGELPQWGVLVCLAVSAFVQNMAFTAVSRSRASGDVMYHARCAVWSNGIWFVTQVLIVSNIWQSINTGDWLFVALSGVVYTVATVVGSAYMMHILLKKETGLRRVGAYKDGVKKDTREDPSRTHKG